MNIFYNDQGRKTQEKRKCDAKPDDYDPCFINRFELAKNELADADD